jgi:hypothetical protein
MLRAIDFRTNVIRSSALRIVVVRTIVSRAGDVTSALRTIIILTSVVKTKFIV